jgi:hypothetical protein
VAVPVWCCCKPRSAAASGPSWASCAGPRQARPPASPCARARSAGGRGGEFTTAQSGTIGQNHHGVENHRPQRRVRRRIGAGNVEHLPNVGRAEDVRSSMLSCHFPLWTGVEAFRWDAGIKAIPRLSQEAPELLAFSRVIAGQLGSCPARQHRLKRCPCQFRGRLEEPIEPQ